MWYLLLYALERALVEGLRTDSLYLMGLRVSQMLSLAAAVVVCAVFVARAGRLPWLVRCVPAVDALLLGIAIALRQEVLCVVFALAMPGFAAMIYHFNPYRSKADEQEG